MDVVSFTRMDAGTAEDYALLARKLAPHVAEMRARLPGFVLDLVKSQRGNALGYPIDRMQHSLQTATRALRDGSDEETVAIALLHDIGDGIGVHNHSEFAAALLRPFISERNAWVVEHHGLFQGYYFYHYVGLDRNERDRYRDHPNFQACVDFCDRWDQRSFDPRYDTMPLSAFEPIVHRLFEKSPAVY
jgi:predicted HD phosphohydrolase